MYAIYDGRDICKIQDGKHKESFEDVMGEDEKSTQMRDMLIKMNLNAICALTMLSKMGPVIIETSSDTSSEKIEALKNTIGYLTEDAIGPMVDKALKDFMSHPEAAVIMANLMM